MSIKVSNDKDSIRITNLSKNFGAKKALNHIDLEISKGMFGLLGPNGAGKTTLMKIIVTLLKKSEGEVEVCGIPVNKTGEIRQIIGYLPQDFSMYGNMSVYEALDYLATLSGMSKADRKIKVPETLRMVNLIKQQKTKVGAMSGGMKRRLGIAQAIIHNPKVIIVDEPTAGLDPEERVRFRNMLCEIANERIVLLSTHIVGDIEATCEEIAILNQGEIAFRGKVKELLDLVKGKVYTAQISSSELGKIKEKYMVTGMLTSGSVSNVKLISDRLPFESAKVCEPDVEDAYMYLMKQQGVR